MEKDRMLSEKANVFMSEAETAPTSPILSSVQAGWEGMIARIYHEPAEVESAIIPAVPDLSLVMVTHGTVFLEIRDAGGYGSWKALHSVGLPLEAPAFTPGE
jgi:hypothetical protein